MAHFARLDSSNRVTEVVVVANEVLLVGGTESESEGVAFLKGLYGADTVWVQTSYNKNIRKNFAGIGFTYDPVADHFYSAPTYPSWVFNNELAIWEAPMPRPVGDMWRWDEETLTWIEAAAL